MKTFDEAFAVVYKQPQELLTENLKSAVSYKENKDWMAMISNLCDCGLPQICGIVIGGMQAAQRVPEEIDKELKKELGLSDQEAVTHIVMPHEVANMLTQIICRMLHNSFQMGVLTGIEMEKPE